MASILNRRRLGIAVFQHVIGGQRFAALAVTLDALRRDRMLAPDAASFISSRFRKG